MSDSIRDILQRADRGAHMPILRGDVVEGVRRKARRQQFARGFAAVAAAVMAGVAIYVMSASREQPQVVMTPPPLPRAPIMSETDLKVATMTAELVEKYENTPHTSGSGSNAAIAQEYLWKVAEEPNQTALILVRSADRIYQQSHDKPAAAASYRQAIRLFPDSPAAGVARERLRNFGDKGNES